jgi:hypothetical protein
MALSGIGLLASDFCVWVRSGARDRSRIRRELVLQPEYSAQPRVPPRRDLRREARGAGGWFTLRGRLRYFCRRYATGLVVRVEEMIA